MPCDEATRRLLTESVRLVSESHALNYALSMTLASTPRDALSREEIDALCQLSYEVQTKLSRALELLQDCSK